MMGKAQLDMAQYKKIFGTCRLPGDKRDRLSFNGDSTHVTVMHNNHIFRVELCGEDNVVLNEDQIVQQLQRVIEMSNNRTNDAIGLLTSDNRDNWAKAYEILKKDHVTKESLADVERSLFILCLDSRVGLHNEPDANARRNVAAAQTIHGGGSTSNGGNRWFDKTIQFIVGADGVAGLTYEHSPAEGQPIAVMTDYIINYIEQGKAEKKRPSLKPKEPVHLKFNINSEVQGLIKEAAANLDKLVCNLELNCFKFDMYGKNFIKSQKLSPDSYLQMAMQLAFFRLHKTPGAHYESAATRMYVGGRTETIRSCSIESIEFAKAMLNPQVSSKDKVMALQRAIKGHKDYTVQALQGLGVDRHLLGLKLTAIENGIEVPKLYSDPGYLKSSRMRISTSQVACKCDGFMCYGPLVADGYATCYNPRDADVNLATSALRHPASSARRYGAALDQSLRDMHDVLLQTLPSKFDKIPVEMMGKAQLDMAQYKKIFGTCRLPGDKRDRLSFNGDSTHVTVMHNNHIFRVELCGEDNVVLNEDQIVQQLQRVIEMSNNRTNDAIGLLTSDNRDNWAKAYEILKKDHVTKESLADVERSLFILCLDSRVGLHNEPDANARRNVAAAQTIHGGGSTSNGGNRWFDKTIQFIVGADGVAGLTYEHSPAEGQPIAVMTDYIINYIEQGKAEKKRPSLKPKEPVHLKFNINSEVQGLIKEAAANLDKLVCNLELNCFKFDMYGKNFIKSQKLSPDSYLQMAMQLAFFRLHKTPGAHYESAATRMYVGGRTETIRSCSIESIEFAKAMLNPQVSSKDKVMALQRAIKGHKDYTVQALQGLGVDRHLLGLKLTAIENGIEVPKLYSDPGYLKSSRMRISTSQVACKCDGFMCYGPLVADGYATCYNPRDADVNLATSALRHPASSARRYGAALDQSLRDMHDVLLQTLPSKL